MHTQQRIIVVKNIAGLGDKLKRLAACWLYAKETGRDLLVAWPASTYLWNQETNLFPLLFKENQKIDGVTLRTSTMCIDEFPTPIVPEVYESVEMIFDVRTRKTEAEHLVGDAVRNLCERPEPTLIFDNMRFKGSKMEDPKVFSSFFKQIQLVPEVAEVVESFTEEHFSDSWIIGMHIRHGNGEGRDFIYRSKSAKQWNACISKVFLDIQNLIERKCPAGKKPLLFLATDSVFIEKLVLKKSPIPIVSTAKWLPKKKTGGLHMKQTVRRMEDPLQVAKEALVDLLLLSKCDALVRTPSNFTVVAVSLLKAKGSVVRTIR